MTKNDCGIYIDGYQEIFVGDLMKSHVRVRWGSDNGLWGFAMDVGDGTGGFGYGLSDQDLKYGTEDECKRVAFESLKKSIVKYNIPDNLMGELHDKLFQYELDLFGNDLYGVAQ